jgi:hypothetical protein
MSEGSYHEPGRVVTTRGWIGDLDPLGIEPGLGARAELAGHNPRVRRKCSPSGGGPIWGAEPPLGRQGILPLTQGGLIEYPRAGF